MTKHKLFDIADNFFTIMREAEDKGSYDDFMKSCDFREDESLSEEKFLKELDEMNNEWGAYKGREFLTTLSDFNPKRTRFAWKAIFEKGEVMVVLGLIENEHGHQVDEFYYY